MVVLGVVLVDLGLLLEVPCPIGRGSGSAAAIIATGSERHEEERAELRQSLSWTKKASETHFMSSSTPKSFRHFSTSRSMAFAFGTSNWRARKNLHRTFSIASRVAGRRGAPKQRRIVHALGDERALGGNLRAERVKRSLLRRRQVAHESRRRLVRRRHRVREEEEEGGRVRREGRRDAILIGQAATASRSKKRGIVDVYFWYQQATYMYNRGIKELTTPSTPLHTTEARVTVLTAHPRPGRSPSRSRPRLGSGSKIRPPRSRANRSAARDVPCSSAAPARLCQPPLSGRKK
jgi:hypothetical protein